MKNIAFVGTEYHQNILFSISLYKAIKFDIVFVKEGIEIHSNIDKYTDKVIVYKNIPYSWKFISEHYREYKSKILPEIDIDEIYQVFSWSVEQPIVKLLLNHLKKIEINLYEDGIGSYVERGPFQLGVKHFIQNMMMQVILNVISLKIKKYKTKDINGWALYSNSFPTIGMNRYLIEHRYFQKIISDSIADKKVKKIVKNTVVFIQQPYVEMAILTEEEYNKIHTEVVIKIKSYMKKEHLKVMWKLHPRTNREDEHKRINIIQEQTGIEMKIIDDNVSMEHFSYIQRQNSLYYFSLGSSSLYVLLALIPENTSVFLIENTLLLKKLPTQAQVNRLYHFMGITLI